MLNERKSWSFYYKKELENLYLKNKVFILNKNLVNIDTQKDMSYILNMDNYLINQKNYKYYSFINEDIFSNRENILNYLEEDFILDINEFDAFEYKLKKAFVFYFPNSYNPYNELSSKFKLLTSPDWRWTIVAIGVRLNGDISISNKVFNFEDKNNAIDNILKSIGSKTLCNKRIKTFENCFEINDLLYSKENKNGRTSESFKDLYCLFVSAINNSFKYNLYNYYKKVCNYNNYISHSLKEYHSFKGKENRFNNNFLKSRKGNLIRNFFMKMPSEIKKSIPSDVKRAINKTGKHDIYLYQWLNNSFKKNRKYRLQAIENFPSFCTTLIKYQKEIDSGSSIINILVSEFNVSRNIIKKFNGFTNKKTKGLFNELNKVGPELYLKVIKSFNIRIERSEDFKYLFIFYSFLNYIINIKDYKNNFFDDLNQIEEVEDNNISYIIDIMKKRPINDIKKYCIDLGFKDELNIHLKLNSFKDGIMLLVNNLLLPYVIQEKESFKNNISCITYKDIQTYQYIYLNKYINKIIKDMTLEEVFEHGIKLDKKMTDIDFMNNLYYDDQKFPMIEEFSEEESKLYSKYNKNFWPGLIKDDRYYDEKNNIEIIPIKNIYDLEKEGELMQHCVGYTYNTLCYKGKSFIFSLRKDKKHIATLSLFIYKTNDRKEKYNLYNDNEKIFFEDKKNNIKIINDEFKGYNNNAVPKCAIESYNKFRTAINNKDIKIDYDFLFGHSQYIKRVFKTTPVFEIINFNPASNDAQYYIKRRFDEFLTKKEKKLLPIDFQKRIII